MSRKYEEHLVAKACIEYLHRVHPGVPTWRHDGGDYAPPQVRQREKEAGGRVLGNTDVCIGIWGRTKKHLEVEFKPLQGGVVTAPQKKMHAMLKRSGFKVVVVRSLIEFIEALEEHGTAPAPADDEDEAEEDATQDTLLPPAVRTPPLTQPAVGDTRAQTEVIVVDCTSDGEEEETQRAQGAQRDGEREAPLTPVSRAARTSPSPRTTQSARRKRGGMGEEVVGRTSDGEEEAQPPPPGSWSSYFLMLTANKSLSPLEALANHVEAQEEGDIMDDDWFQDDWMGNGEPVEMPAVHGDGYTSS